MKAFPALIVITMTSFPAWAFTGSENFNGAGKDAAKWGADIISGAGVLNQSGGVLRYSTSGSVTDEDSRVWPWIVGNAPLNVSWAVQADVNVPFIALGGSHDAVAMGIAVINAADFDDSFALVLEQITDAGPQFQSFTSFVNIDGHGPEIFQTTSTVSGSVRIRWDAVSRTLFSEFDADGAVGGYNWTVFNSFKPVNPWNLSGTHPFQLAIFGESENTVVTEANNVFADNFVVQLLDPPANFAGSDDFNDNSKDLAKWGPDIQGGRGELIETGGKLLYRTIVPPTSDDAAERPWILNAGSYTNDWAIQVDLQLTNLSNVRVGMKVVNSSNPTNLAAIHLNTEGTRKFHAEIENNDVAYVNATASTSSARAAVRISWDSVGKILSLQYDADGAHNGYSWTTLGGTNISAGPFSWGMTSNDWFLASLFVESSGTTVLLADEVCFDNFRIGGAESVSTVLNGRDNFDDGAKNPFFWGDDVVEGGGRFEQAGGGLKYLVDAPNGGDLAARPWVRNCGSFTESWFAQAEINLPDFALGAGQEIHLGLEVVNSANPNLTANINLEIGDLDDGFPNLPRKIDAEFENGTTTQAKAVFGTSNTQVALRVEWNSRTKLLSLMYDADGAANGFSWTTLLSRDLTASPTDWGMGTNDCFQVRLFGESENRTITLADNVQFENFETVTIPEVQIGRTNSIALSWPVWAEDFLIQTANSLQFPIIWNDLIVEPTTSGQTRRIVLPDPSTNTFYRLLR